jgi:hypothetical protein
VLPAADGAIATEAQLDSLRESVVERVVAAGGKLLSDPPTDLEVAVGAMVLLLALRRRGAGAAGASRAGARGEAETRL